MEYSNFVKDITGSFIRDKVKQNPIYAQHLYVALCNNCWQKFEIFPVLKGEIYSFSWRSAGRLIAELKEEGNYLDWYCSGTIAATDNLNKALYSYFDDTFVSEGTITREIELDLKNLGWHTVPDDDL